MRHEWMRIVCDSGDIHRRLNPPQRCPTTVQRAARPLTGILVGIGAALHEFEQKINSCAVPLFGDESISAQLSSTYTAATRGTFVQGSRRMSHHE